MLTGNHLKIGKPLAFLRATPYMYENYLHRNTQNLFYP
jgi:hypothetical protein